ncbi:MAG TPA: hypothetical protein VK501_16995 [Baekduia sp.]|uniref:hypothetical protein n=1 Tax=Baekduia sp. TaxID=2600305 RepID=UPI002C61D055|nr:hypothetical protein [Baekduia sp.]HMJ35609.1 hypothetical protein [Baekduia sp.]
MVLKGRLAVVVAALAVGAPVAAAAATTAPAADPVVSGPSCPDGYAGPTNLATGCPYWMMSYTVAYPGQPALRCPTGWSPPPGAAAAAAPAPEGCGAVPTAQ